MIALLVFALLSGPTCHSRGPLPDNVCTPGAVETTDLAVICGQATKARRHVSEATKRLVLAEYGIAQSERHGWVIDHRIPIEVGGANSTQNLAPQTRVDAEAKDVYENLAHREVCSGQISVEAAQRAFMGDWRLIR
jgi:hypothetical protein